MIIKPMNWRYFTRTRSFGAVLVLLIFLQNAVSQAATPISPISSFQGELVIHGHVYTVEAEYWGTELWLTADAKLEDIGLAGVFWSNVRNTWKITDFDEKLRWHTSASKEDMLAHRAAREDTLKRYAQFLAKHPDPPTMQVVIIVRVREGNEAKQFQVFSPVKLPEIKVVAPVTWFVATLATENGVWLKDETIHEHPVAVELRYGRWKQFGAPRDYEVPKPATMPTSQPASKQRGWYAAELRYVTFRNHGIFLPAARG